MGIGHRSCSWSRRCLGEGLPGLVQVGLGRALGAAEGVGDLGDAQVVEVVEGDRGGLAVGEAPDERPEPVDLGRWRVQLAPGSHALAAPVVR